MQSRTVYGITVSATVLVLAAVTGFIGATSLGLDRVDTPADTLRFSTMFPGSDTCERDRSRPPDLGEDRTLPVYNVTLRNRLPIPRLQEIPGYAACFTPNDAGDGGFDVNRHVSWRFPGDQTYKDRRRTGSETVELGVREEKKLELRVPRQCSYEYRSGASEYTPPPNYTALLLVPETEEAPVQCGSLTAQQKQEMVRIPLTRE
jgi:hypothetical protein